MLFSDIEGSTLLLARMGDRYAEALDVQRTVLRAAWNRWGGLEMGTEGDSFFVVFTVARDAVSAAVQAQRELVTYPWPQGERVWVRMGVHSGEPVVHDGGYVGMDVHRAARIAGAAHGGQVVVSNSTRELVRARLPAGIRLVDLGAHQLKDIAAKEHLFQLAGDGLATDFPPLRSVGTTSSLPMPATPLVGREGELVEMQALLASPGVRLLTLIGPGGSGKTRLATELARQLVDAFPDGVYFVSLATVTDPDVMWTTIGETLGLPPDSRVPPRMIEHVAHLRALLVLDNLEQLLAADAVVAELMAAAPQVVVIVTSRRPLHLANEHQHPVPPLELPTRGTLEEVERSGAVRMFVQYAEMVRPGFALTADNAEDVAGICQQLDGLPLAIELAAARTKLLTPRALIARLGLSLELRVSGVDRPARQQTLRDTIAWSYGLLTPDRQAFFRQLGVFAGGADLSAIAAVTAHRRPAGADPLDLVAEMVDASLVMITDAPDGEPRVGMLQTVRAYAHDRLTAAGEADLTRRQHAYHYLEIAQSLAPLAHTDRYLEARNRLEVELENLREALTWAHQPDQVDGASTAQAWLRLRLCDALSWFWRRGGYLAEGRRWLEQTIELAGDGDDPILASCLDDLARLLAIQGHNDRARELAAVSVAMWRSLRDNDNLAKALNTLAIAEYEVGDTDAARGHLEEAVDVARRAKDRVRLAGVLGNLSSVEVSQGNHERAIELLNEGLTIERDLGDVWGVTVDEHNMAWLLVAMGRVDEAHGRVEGLVGDVLALNDPELTINFAEVFAAILAGLGDVGRAAGLLGAAEAMRERTGIPRNAQQEPELRKALGVARAKYPSVDWAQRYDRGVSQTVEDLLVEAQRSSPQREKIHDRD